MAADRRVGSDWLTAIGPVRVGLAVVVVALACLGLVEWFSQALLPSVPTLKQADPVTQGALPVAELALNAAGTLTVGWLLLVVVFLPSEGQRLSVDGQRALRAASFSAVAWAVVAFAVAVLSVSNLLGLSVGEAISRGELTEYFINLSEGWALLTIMAIAAVVSVGAHVPRTTNGAGILLMAAVVALVPLVPIGHAADSSYHALAVYSLVFHLIGAAAWVGGLAVMVLMARRLMDRLPEIVPRYSRLALVCFVMVAISGLTNAWIRLGRFEPDLDSRYGALVVAKTAALTALALFGWWHRRSSIPALRTQRRARTFLRIAAVEVIVMAATMAVATGLARTTTPLLEDDLGTAAETILGFDLPGPHSIRAYALDWWVDPLFAVLVLAGAALYVAGVVRLRRRKLDWPPVRAVAWFTGLAIVLVATSSGMARYSMVTFSAHLVQHLILSLIAPIAFILGRPVTLAQRVLGTDEPASGQTITQLLVALARSKAIRLLAHPLVALAILVTSLYGFYFTVLFEASLRDHALHSLVMTFFVAIGALFLWPVIGGGPGPNRMRHRTRFLLLAAVIPFHIAFGVTLLKYQRVLAGDWYEFLLLGWGPPQLREQQMSGWLTIILGVVATAIAMLILAFKTHPVSRTSKEDQSHDR